MAYDSDRPSHKKSKKHRRHSRSPPVYRGNGHRRNSAERQERSGDLDNSMQDKYPGEHSEREASERYRSRGGRSEKGFSDRERGRGEQWSRSDARTDRDVRREHSERHERRGGSPDRRRPIRRDEREPQEECSGGGGAAGHSRRHRGRMPPRCVPLLPRSASSEGQARCIEYSVVPFVQGSTCGPDERDMYTSCQRGYCSTGKVWQPVNAGK